MAPSPAFHYHLAPAIRVRQALAHPDPPRAATLHIARGEAGSANTGPGWSTAYRFTPQHSYIHNDLTLPRRPHDRQQERDA